MIEVCAGFGFGFAKTGGSSAGAVGFGESSMEADERFARWAGFSAALLVTNA